MVTIRSASLGSPRDLAAFHEHRARAYDVVGELTGAAPTAERLRMLRARWPKERHGSAAREADDLRDILEPVTARHWSQEYRALVGDRSAPALLVCKDAAARVRWDAATLLAFPLDSTRPREALLLASLARITARYLSDDRLLEATGTMDLQVRLLGLHAADCLGEWGRALAAFAGAPRYSRLGRCLTATLAEDHRLLFARGTARGNR